ncbi:hypothetical protein LNO81_30405 [Klebsiella variicola subsp. variicola]|nr:hypothetical protein [Klebsiella variicola subsp. variicola]
MSGRANDSLQKFIPRGNWRGKEHSTIYFTLQEAELLIDAMRSHAESLKGSDLKAERKKYLNDYLTGIDRKSSPQHLNDSLSLMASKIQI